MQLGVLVDRAVDAHEQALRLELGEMLLEIERDSLGMRAGLIEHALRYSRTSNFANAASSRSTAAGGNGFGQIA